MTLAEFAIFTAACAVPCAVGYIWFAAFHNARMERQNLLTHIAACDARKRALAEWDAIGSELSRKNMQKGL